MSNHCLPIVLLTMLLAPAAMAADAVVTRQEAIRQSLAAIDQELKQHGGTWDAWARNLAPYRDDIRGYVTDAGKHKWPWPAKNGYVFQGAALRLHLLDELEALPEGERPLEAIAHLNRQLRARGIDLIVAFIPAKMSIHPDYINAAGEQRLARAPEDRQVSLAIKRLMHSLLKADVEVVDLHEAFRQFRLKKGDDVPLYYVRDSHFLNRGARVAAEAIGQRLRRYDFVQAALAAGNPFVTEKGERTDGIKADPDLLLIRQRAGGGFYADVADSPVVVAGDSHLLYNDGKAAVSAQIAHQIAMPVGRMGREGLSADIPVALAADPHLPKRRVVVTLYSERMLAPRKGQKWPLVDLPRVAAAATQAAQEGLAAGIATGTIAEISALPDVRAPYPHYFMKFYLKGLADPSGKPVGDGEAVVTVLAMRNRKVLPVAQAAVGQKLSLKLTAWPAMQKTHGRIRTGVLPTVQLEVDKPLYWGEVPGGEQLTAAELGRAGEEDAPESRGQKP